MGYSGCILVRGDHRIPFNCNSLMDADARNAEPEVGRFLYRSCYGRRSFILPDERCWNDKHALTVIRAGFIISGAFNGLGRYEYYLIPT